MQETETLHHSTTSLRRLYTEMYGGSARLFRAPGRVNLIGEHTDYNDGFVMPAAIEFSTLIAAGLGDDTKLRVYSDKFGDAREWELNSIRPGPTGHWSDYVRGVAGIMQSRGYKLRGANMVVNSNVPVGSGLSSSAAIEVASAFALMGISGLDIPRAEVALICQQAEHEYADSPCGIMDQFISANGRAGYALLLDCRSLGFEYLPMPAGAKVVICDSRVKHSVSGGEYAERRAACEAGVAHLKKSLPDIRALRDVTPQQLETYKTGLPEVTYRRCRHVVGEIQRTLDAAAALKASDLVKFGLLMYESHRSLRDDYEVSCQELDVLVELAHHNHGVYGARMTGAGFGGCTVNLVEDSAVAAFQQNISSEYKRVVGQEPYIYITNAADGAGECPGASRDIPTSS
jgi:galactokinase